MKKLELVLSSTTSFFLSGIQAAFRNAAQMGFKYLEIVPFRWTKPAEIFHWERKYHVRVAGIHLPPWWKKSIWQAFRSRPLIWEKLLTCCWAFYLGKGIKSPGLAIAEKSLPQKPYLLIHANLIDELGEDAKKLASQFHLVIENIPYHKTYPDYYWDPITLKEELRKRQIATGLVFDPAHFQSALKKFSRLNMLETYRAIAPEIVHIGYNSRGVHVLPNPAEQEKLEQMLQICQPKYIVLETNLLVSVRKGKEMMEKLLKKF